MLCRRAEEKNVDINSTQAQVIIGVRRSGKSTLCYQVLHGKGVKYSQKSKLRTVQEKVYTVDVAMMD